MIALLLILAVNIPPVAHITTNPKGCPAQPDGYTPYVQAVAHHYTPVPYFSEQREALGARYWHLEYRIEAGKTYEVQYTTSWPVTNYIWTQPPDTNNWPTTNWIAFTRLGPYTNSFDINVQVPVYLCENRFLRVTSN